jgi:hypothetical protein
MRKTTCPNTEIHGTGWNRPVMVRLYIRESQKATHDKEGNRIPWGDQVTKRTWMPVGQMCPGCRWIVLDEIPEEVSA